MLRDAWQAARSVGRQCVQALPLVRGGVRAVGFALRHRSPRVKGALGKANVQRARQDPLRVFLDPKEVAESAELSTGDKQAILRSWQEDATHLAVAEGEGMGGGEPSRLPEVTEAKTTLEHAPPGAPQSLEKQG